MGGRHRMRPIAEVRTGGIKQFRIVSLHRFEQEALPKAFSNASFNLLGAPIARGPGTVYVESRRQESTVAIAKQPRGRDCQRQVVPDVAGLLRKSLLELLDHACLRPRPFLVQSR